jgi:hypothetical protein
MAAAVLAGDVDATKLVQNLLEKTSEPYFSMLELWLCQGLLNDPYSEFMVEEDKVHLPQTPCPMSCHPTINQNFQGWKTVLNWLDEWLTI